MRCDGAGFRAGPTAGQAAEDEFATLERAGDLGKGVAP